jgi:hypothetical protein
MLSIEIRYAEKLGDSKIKLYWESDSQAFELIESQYLYNVLNSQKTPYQFTVIPASTNETTSYLVDLE